MNNKNFGSVLDKVLLCYRRHYEEEHFGLFLKECEWRFNNPKPKAQLKHLKQWVKQNLT